MYCKYKRIKVKNKQMQETRKSFAHIHMPKICITVIKSLLLTVNGLSWLCSMATPYTEQVSRIIFIVEQRSLWLERAVTCSSTPQPAVVAQGQWHSPHGLLGRKREQKPGPLRAFAPSHLLLEPKHLWLEHGQNPDWDLNPPFFFFCLFGAVLAAYGGSQARSLIRAVVVGRWHSHNKARSKPRLQPIPQLAATPDP